MQKAKTYIKYATHILATIGAILAGVSQIWHIPYAVEIGQTIAVIIGVICGGWLCDKAYEYCKQLQRKE